MKMAKFPILIAINKNFNIKLTILKSTTAIIFSALFLFMVHGQLSYCQDSFSVIYLEELQDDYILNDDLYILHIPTSEEIFMAVKELEGLLSGQIPLLTPLQKKIRESRGHHLLSDGLSRISDYYLSEHINFFK